MPCDPTRYPDDWPRLRTNALRRADRRCQGCGARHLEDGTIGTSLTVHHPDRDPENPRPRLTVLCARCHLSVEPQARARERWLATGTRTKPFVHDNQLELNP
jgi:5-methylcytosine-specific restriction endonuclease McrA